jgi:hypothetical protein
MITAHRHCGRRTPSLLQMSKCTVFFMPYPSKTDRQTILFGRGERSGAWRYPRLVVTESCLAPNAIYRYLSNVSATEILNPLKNGRHLKPAGKRRADRQARLAADAIPQSSHLLRQAEKGLTAIETVLRHCELSRDAFWYQALTATR